MAVVVAPFLRASASFFGKGASFSKPVDDGYKGAVGQPGFIPKQILVGQGRCFSLQGFISTWKSGQEAAES